ncbi:Copia protein [Cyberlindnera fabianii]|uniref:Copia protein n=1 Tax=Cyberlindnera fabianii TaxID=36022 RepID=A0A1V2L345_CYBFA|nr:Copia protein [Cyberlindnera fabianii]
MESASNADQLKNVNAALEALNSLSTPVSSDVNVVIDYLAQQCATFTTILEQLPPEHADSCLFLSYLQNKFWSERPVKKIMSAYHQRYRTDMSNFTLATLSGLALTELPSTAAPSPSSDSDYRPSPTKSSYWCHNCHQPGHIARVCPLPKTAEYLKKVEEHKEREKQHLTSFGVSDVLKNNHVYISSGCSRHIFNNSCWFQSISPTVDEEVCDVSGKPLPVSGTGNVLLPLQDGSILQLNNCMFIPSATANLVSVPQATSKGVKFSFTKSSVRATNPGCKGSFEFARRLSGSSLYSVMLTHNPADSAMPREL